MRRWLEGHKLSWVLWRLGLTVLVVGIWVDYPVHRSPLRWVVLAIWVLSFAVSAVEAVRARRRQAGQDGAAAARKG